MNKRTELALLLRAGQQIEAQTPPSNASRGLDRIWSAAARDGLVSPAPPCVPYPPPYPAPSSPSWRIALIAVIIAALAVAGSVVVWQHVNSGRMLINTEIPSGGDSGGGNP